MAFKAGLEGLGLPANSLITQSSHSAARRASVDEPHSYVSIAVIMLPLLNTVVNSGLWKLNHTFSDFKHSSWVENATRSDVVSETSKLSGHVLNLGVTDKYHI